MALHNLALPSSACFSSVAFCITYAWAPSTAVSLAPHVTALIALTSQCHILHHGHIVSDHSRCANDDPSAMVQQDALSKLGGWVDVHCQGLAGPAGRT